jgi:hypothetical protein
MIKKIYFIVAFVTLLITNVAKAANQVITDCDGSISSKVQAIQSKINLANAGEEVFFDCSTGNFTAGVALDINKGITIRGRGQVKSGTTVTYLTKFTVNSAQIFNVTVPNGASFRLTGIEFTGSPGEPLIDLNGHFGSLRVDHCGFTNISQRTFRVGYNTRTGGAIHGLFDNNTYSNTNSHQFMLYYGNDTSWTEPEDYGTTKAIYFEDNDFKWGVAGVNNTPCDGEHGARFVIRNNTFTNTQFQWHDTGSTQEARSTRHFEIYNNILKCTVSNCGWGPVGFRGGTGVFYNNQIPYGANGYENASVSQIWRSDKTGSFPWTNLCDSTQDKICSNFLANCSTNADCPSGSTCLPKIDGHKGSTQNTTPATPAGWPCRDQTGRGQEDLVNHIQKASPMYWWGNRTPSGARLDPWMANDEFIQPNRDYYQEVPSFNGTSGVGVGPLSSRPSTCRGPIKDTDGYELTGGVGYWATDQNKLYHCSATNTWSVLFEPLQYPHPLQGNVQPPVKPMAPTGLDIS